MKQILYSLSIVLALNFMFASCQKEPETIKVTSVTLNVSSMILTEGEIGTLTATVSPSNASNKAVLWNSSNTNIATVDNGKITAMNPGTSTITVTTDDGGKTAICQVEVNSKIIAVESVSLNVSTIELLEGEDITLVATILPENATDKSIVWNSSDETVASVKDGRVTAVKAGSGIITATVGGKSAICSIKVFEKAISVTDVQIDRTEIEMTEGDKATLYATVKPDNASNKNVIWSSSKPEIVTVDNGDVTAIKTGTAEITVKTEDGNKTATCKVVVKERNYDNEPFTITSKGIISVAIAKNEFPDEIILEYRTNAGDWDSYDIGTKVALFDGDWVQFRAGDQGNTTFSTGHIHFYYVYTEGEGTISASGNVMSLVDKTLQKKDVADFEFSSLFHGCTALTNAAHLVLPATKLADYCYAYMFYWCSGLLNAPSLPATSLAKHCYYEMFDSCNKLSEAPDLPATTLAESCYNSMFAGCAKLIEAPDLPATKLERNCYREMFWLCTHLEKVPCLPARTLADYCYHNMFKSCTRLNYIKALFVTTPSWDYTRDWLLGVSSSGTFVKNKDATWEVIGADGIPDGWSVETE